RIAARAVALEQPVDVSGRVAHERERARADLCGDELTRAARPDGLPRLRVEELTEEVASMEVHPVVDAALARERADLRLAAVVEELDAEHRPELRPQARRQQLRGGEAHAIVEVTAGIEAHLPRRVAQVGKEARRAGVDRGAVVACDLHLEL